MHQHVHNNHDTEEQLFDFDDIELYTRVYWRGRPGWILDKGYHVSDGDPDARHILVQYEGNYDGRREANIHENIVNKYLADGRKLWVDFDEHLTRD